MATSSRGGLEVSQYKLEQRETGLHFVLSWGSFAVDLVVVLKPKGESEIASASAGAGTRRARA